jgi:hypothetical protein
MNARGEKKGGHPFWSPFLSRGDAASAEEESDEESAVESEK